MNTTPFRNLLKNIGKRSLSAFYTREMTESYEYSEMHLEIKRI